MSIDDFTSQGKPIVYIDESGFAYDMPRTHGYCAKGQRCYGMHNWHAKGRTNVIGALLGATLLTIGLVSGSVNSNVFHAWLERDLIPKLPPGCVLVMDNAAFHKRHFIQETIKNANHTIEYLPPYSPDLNPIEHKWAQAKKVRRKKKCSIDKLFKEYEI